VVYFNDLHNSRFLNATLFNQWAAKGPGLSRLKKLVKDIDHTCFGNLVKLGIIYPKHGSMLALPKTMRTPEGNLMNAPGFFQIILNKLERFLVSARKATASHANGYFNIMVFHYCLANIILLYING